MAYGSVTCKTDPSITADQAFELLFGRVPDGYEVVRFCSTLECTRHVTIRKIALNKFEIPLEMQLRPSSNPKLQPWTDERRLKTVRALHAHGHNSFVSSATTWQGYCRDYLTSLATTKLQKIYFCVHHFMSQGMPCHCGYKHEFHCHKPRPNAIYNGISLADHIRDFPWLDCGKAITGEAFGKVPPSKEYYRAEAENQAPPEETDFASQAFEQAYLEVSVLFRPIKVLKLKHGGENWMHRSALE